DDIAIWTLLTLSKVLGIASTPSTTGGLDWKIEQKWHQESGRYTLTASSKQITEHCLRHPERYIEFPRIIHASHRILLNGRLIEQFGEPSFAQFRSFYGAPVLSCKRIYEMGELVWQPFSYSRYFARFHFFPRLVKGAPSTPFLHEILNIIAGGFLLTMAAINFIIFFGKLPTPVTVSFCLSNVFFSGYFIFANAGFFN